MENLVQGYDKMYLFFNETRYKNSAFCFIQRELRIALFPSHVRGIGDFGTASFEEFLLERT
jgi:hypothetical protein